MDFEKTFEIEPNFIVHIIRVHLNKNNLENYKLIPIQNCACLYFNPNQDPFMLPKLYAALTHLTGPGDSCYDDYKGSYSFTFELKVQKNRMASKYVYHIYHYRSYIEFSVYHKVPKTDPREIDVLYKPNDELFSDRDICLFSNFFCGYSLGYMAGTKYMPKPFVKFSDSNNLCFGHSGSEYFFKACEDSDQFEYQKTVLLKEK